MTSIINRRAVLGVSSAAFATSLFLPKRAQAETPAAPSAPTTPRPAVEAYARPPLVDNIALSPDGKRVALITQKGDEKLLIHFDVTNQQSSTLRLGPAKIRSLFWGDNTHVILTNSTTIALHMFAGGRHEFSIGRNIDTDTYKVQTLFSKEEDFYGIVFGDMQRIKVDGEYRVTASNRRMDVSGEIFLYSFGLSSERGSPLIRGSAITQDFVITPEGKPVAYADFDDDRKEWNLYYNVDLDKGGKTFRRVYRQKGEAIDYPDLLGLGRDGKSVLIRVNAADSEEALGFHEISADGVLGPQLDKEGFGTQRAPLFHPTTARLAGFSRHEDWVTLNYFDPLMKKLNDALPEAMGEGARTLAVSYAEDPRKMIVYVEDAHDAGSYFYCNFATGDVQQIASNYEELPPEWITEKQAITYKAADGLEIHGYLTLPPFREAKNLPLVVLPHGGPEARDYISYDWQTQVLASQGYAVLQPNFRGSTGYGGAFVTAGDGEFGRKMQTDLSDGVRHLVSKGIADPKRVAIMGASYGGYAAMAGATLDTGVYRCAVAVAGVSDPKSFVDYVDTQTGDSLTSVRVWRKRLGDRKTYDEISPARQADKADCPILLIHGTDDTVVPIDQSRRMEKALKAAGKPVEFITYKGQDHWETQGSSRIAMMEAAIAFLQKHNPA